MNISGLFGTILNTDVSK